MGTSVDFLKWLETDMSLMILTCIDDPSDLVRAASVSHFWRNFVIANGLFKQLCFRMFPQFQSVAHVTEISCGTKKRVDVGPSKTMERATLEKEHRVYSVLVGALTTITVGECISGAIGASSTDNYPQETVLNTLDPRDRIFRRASYWSSTGQSDPSVPESLLYKLRGDLCVVTEINIQPFQAYFQAGKPIYSATSVRFRMGHPRFPEDIKLDLMNLPLTQPADNKFIWTYTSQEFPMAQENSLQNFKLPEPTLCIGGFLQVELLGRVQKQEMDGLFYICVAHVEILGQSLSPALSVEILEPTGRFALKYNPEAQSHTLGSFADDRPHAGPFSPSYIEQREILLDLLGANLQFAPNEWDEDDDDEDDDDENDFDDMVMF